MYYGSSDDKVIILFYYFVDMFIVPIATYLKPIESFSHKLSHRLRHFIYVEGLLRDCNKVLECISEDVENYNHRQTGYFFISMKFYSSRTMLTVSSFKFVS